MVKVPETQALHLQPALKDPAAGGGTALRGGRGRIGPSLKGGFALGHHVAPGFSQLGGGESGVPRGCAQSRVALRGCRRPQPHLSRSSQSSPPQRSLNSSVFIPPTRSKSDL